MFSGCGSDQSPPDRLALGITEPNPAFLAPSQHADFERWRPALAAIAPQYYRLVVDWDSSVAPDGAYDPVAPQHGCMRSVQPCAPYAGIRAQLEAVATAQREHPGRFRLLVVPMATPERFAAPPGGCEKPGVEPFARPPRDLDAYRAVIRSVDAEADRAGVAIPYWSPWNEPNGPSFLSPQRARCDPTAPSVSPAAYARLAEAMRAELEPGQELVLGEIASLTEPTATHTTMTEFVAGLPRDLVCAAPIFTVHEYLPDGDGEGDPVRPLVEALDAHRCERRHRVWVTETGVREGVACGGQRAALERWYDDPRVDAAFQYTLREDDLFKTGLVTTGLDADLPLLAEWRAWGSRTDPSAPPPPPACG